MTGKEQRAKTISKFEEEVTHFFNEGQYDKALDASKKLIDSSKKSGDKILEATALRQCAMVYTGADNFKEGLRCCREALFLFKEADDEDGVAYTLLNLGNIHYMLDDIKAALVQYNEAMTLFHQSQDHNGWALVAHQLGRVYQGLGDLERAETLYQKALDIFRKADRQNFMVKVLGGLGQVYAGMDKMELAFDFSIAALMLGLEINDPTVKLAIKDLHDLFRKVGNDDFKELWESTARGITFNEIMKLFSDIASAEEELKKEEKMCS